MNRVVGFLVLLILSIPLCAQTRTDKKPTPETVLVTFQIKQGHEERLREVIDRAWTTYLRLGMVHKDPHSLFKATDEGGDATFLEIFTWKDSSVPDKAVLEVRQLWSEMEGLCEKRHGQAGIEFKELEPVRLNSR